MIGEVFGVISGINAAIELAKSMKDADDALAVRKIQADLLDQLVTAKAAQLDQLEHYKELEAEVVRLRDWQGEKSRYQLVEIVPGGFGYTLKEAERGTERQHCLCPNCYADSKKSLVVATTAVTTGFVFRCSRCGLSFDYEYWREGPPRNWADGMDVNGSAPA